MCVRARARVHTRATRVSPMRLAHGSGYARVRALVNTHLRYGVHLRKRGVQLSADEKRLLDVCSDMRSHFEDASAVSIGESSVMSMAATAAAAGGPKR